MQAFLPAISISNPNSVSLGWVLIGFSFAMALGAVFAWAWIPELQNPRGSETDWRRQDFRSYEVPSKSLEELAVGRIGVTDEKKAVGFRVRSRLMAEKIGIAVRRRRKG